MNYETFIASKRHTLNSFGFEPVWMPESAFDFQRAMIEKSVRKGRIGVFADTGLGKTMVQLSIAQNIVQKTNKRVLILTPLAVAFQFLDEANRIGVDDIEHSRDGKSAAKIVVCNYERLHLLNADDYECVMLDESSILKNFQGKTRDAIVSFIKRVPYRFLSTATPSPNDFIELGNSSEALGYMGYMDMLSKFFKSNQNSSDSNSRNIGEKFYLKPHAETDFFAWVNQWSIMVKKPSDIGFDDSRYELPRLILNHHLTSSKHRESSGGQGDLFAESPIAKTMTEVRQEQKDTVKNRCEMAAFLAREKTSVYWCNLNEESDLLKALDPDAVEIRGAMSIDKKEEILMAFAKAEIKRIITKAKITGMGLNWQHCNHTVFFPTWSYEQYYQSVRRFWRFGQKSDVVCDVVASVGQSRVIEAIEQKTKKAIELYSNLVRAANATFTHEVRKFDQSIQLPGFLK
jgi:Helicase conserved C-terminal domain/DEAD/DEAH box helicase